MSTTPASRKYNARRPRMAKMFEVNAINRLCVMPIMAGTLSTANTTSVLSTTSKTRNIGAVTRLE